ncbi:MAG: ABC transporter ATP-binding protein [Planctomycetaceae bacterium]|nr:ABC transporter ATP-binding protein [Planctomycetaceae bacterium]
MIETDNLTRVYPAPEGELRAVDGVSLSVADGEIVTIIGRSGSGKSTLLHLLGGLDHPTGGTVRVAGRDLAELNERELARYRGDVVGTIFQAFHLMPTLTAVRNVELPLMFLGFPPRERRERATAALTAVGLADRAGHRPSQLSGGEQQRVAIARAIVAEPKVLLADEPTGNLDSETAATVVDLLRSIVRERGLTLILVTHDAGLAHSLGDRVVQMQDGRLVDDAIPSAAGPN